MAIVAFLLLAALIITAAKASLKLFLVTGTVSGKNGQLVKLVHDFYGSSPEVLGSKTIQDNHFRISCKVDKIGPVFLVFDGGKDMIVHAVTFEEGHINFFLNENERV
jgi:hypothetical protein